MNNCQGRDKNTLSEHTSIRHIELDPKVSNRASGAVTGCEDDPTYGLDLPDDAGNSGGGQKAVVSDNQPADLNNADVSEPSMKCIKKTKLNPRC